MVSPDFIFLRLFLGFFIIQVTAAYDTRILNLFFIVDR